MLFPCQINRLCDRCATVSGFKLRQRLFQPLWRAGEIPARRRDVRVSEEVPHIRFCANLEHTTPFSSVRLTCHTVKPPALSAASVSFGSFADMPGTFAEKCRNRRSLGVSGDPLATLIVHLTVPRAVLHDADRSLADTNLPSTR